MDSFEFDSNLMNFEDVEPPMIKLEKDSPNFEVDLQRLTDQLEANDFVIKKVEYITEYDEEEKPEVIVHVNENKTQTADHKVIIKQISREQRRLIAGQRHPVPRDTLTSNRVTENYSTPTFHYQETQASSDEMENNSIKENIITPIVHIRSDIANSFLNMSNEDTGDGIVWTAIPETELIEEEYTETRYENGDEIIDRKSIIKNKDNTKEFLMGKMLESIENESFNGGNTRIVSDIRESELTNRKKTEITFTLSTDTNEKISPLPKSPIPQVELTMENESMQLVSARPCIVVEQAFPTKVSDSGIKKTMAQQSAEARIAKEIEEIQQREAELMQSRQCALNSTSIEQEVTVSSFSLSAHTPSPPSSVTSDKVNFQELNAIRSPVPDILIHQSLPTIPPPPIPIYTFPLEKTKVKPLVDEDSDNEEIVQRYTFYKETAVERDIRLATQREEELRREKQQQLQNKIEPVINKVLEDESFVKFVELESQIQSVPQPQLIQAQTSTVQLKPKQEPLAKLVLSGPAPSAIGYRVQEKFSPSPFSPAKLTVEKNEMILFEKTNAREIHSAMLSPAAITPTSAPNTPTSASISSKPWTLTSPNWNASIKWPSIANDRVTGTLPNRQSTKGLMEKFLANHGRPMPVFVPKTTIPQVQPVYEFTNGKTNGDTNGPANGHANIQANGFANGFVNGHVEKPKENQVETEIAKPQNQKPSVKRLSSVENMILEELRNMQGRELELKKERSTIMPAIEENEQANENGSGTIVNNTGAWGIFTLVAETNSSVC